MIYWSERLLSQNNLVFPKEWGKIEYIGSSTVHKAACAVDESGYDWIYTWSIHFEKGTLPVAVGKTAEAATIILDYFAYDTKSKLNGGCYADGTFVNSIAGDYNRHMTWENTRGNSLYSLANSTAAKMGWNDYVEGENENNKTVFSDAFTFEITNNNKTLIVYKNGKKFGKYSCYS